MHTPSSNELLPLHFAVNPVDVGIWISALHRSKLPIQKTRTLKVNRKRPAWIVKRLNLDAKRVLPVTVALRRIPILQAYEGIHLMANVKVSRRRRRSARMAS